jgi:hypothetical protein
MICRRKEYVSGYGFVYMPSPEGGRCNKDNTGDRVCIFICLAVQRRLNCGYHRPTSRLLLRLSRRPGAVGF